MRFSTLRLSLVGFLGASLVAAAGCSGDDDVGGAAPPPVPTDNGPDAAAPPVTLPEPPPLTADQIAAAEQRPTGEGIVVFDDGEGNVTGISGRLARDRKAGTPEDAAIHFVEDFGRRAWGWKGDGPHVAIWEAEHEPVPVEKIDENGTTGVRVSQVMLVQLHRGLPIEGRELVVTVGEHTDDPGFVIGGLTGRLRPDPATAASETPKLDAEQALRAAAQDPRLAPHAIVTANGVDGTWRGRLVFRDVGMPALSLCWRILVKRSPTHPAPDVSLLVDATSGAVLGIEEQVNDNDFVDVSETGIVIAPAKKGPSPREVLGAFVGVNTPFQQEQGWALLRSFPGPSLGGEMWIGGSIAPWVVNGNSFVGDVRLGSFPFLTDAYEHAATTFAWLDAWRGYRGWDGGGALDLSIEPYSKGTEWNASASTSRGTLNAYSGLVGSRTWNNQAVTGLSVVAHEIGHFVVAARNPLVYEKESGALNEGIADLLSALVRGWSSNRMADDVDDDKSFIRDFADPPVRNHPDRYYSDKKAPLWGGDKGGVHTNSGIVNKAHFLMARGGVFRGYVVTAMAPSPTQVVEAQSRLVMGALMARSFGENTTLREYAAGLTGFCRAQPAMFTGMKLVAKSACDSVQNAFAATELVDATTSPTDLVPTIDAVAPSDVLGQVDATIKIRNRGVTPYSGTIRLDLRRSEGTGAVSSSVILNGVSIAGNSDFVTKQVLGLRSVVNELPYDARFIMTNELPKGSTDTSNDVVTLRIDGVLLPAGKRSDVFVPGPKPQVKVSVASHGMMPFLGRDVAVRVLYRTAASKKFEYGAGAADVQRPAADDRVPLVLSAGAPLVTSEPMRADVAAAGLKNVSFVTNDRELSNGFFVNRLGYLVLQKDGSLKTSDGTPVEGDIVIAAFNADGKMRVNRDGDYFFCLNCAATNYRGEPLEFTSILIGPDVNMPDFFPTDLATIFDDLAVKYGVISNVKFMRPGFHRWITGGPGPGFDPTPIVRPGTLVNPGPL